MRILIGKLRAIAQKAAAEKGKFSFFALLLREDAPDRWDLVVAAPWIDKDKMGALKYLADCVGLGLDADEVLRISRIAPLRAGSPFLSEISQRLITAPGYRGVMTFSGTVSGIPIKQMYIIICRRSVSSVRKRDGSRAGSAKASRAGR
jgi:hypothetical protein